MRVHPLTWVLRALWLALPFTLGAAVGDAVADRSDPVRLTATVGLWVAWGILLVAMAVPRPATLTLLRFGAPASVVVGIIARVAAGLAAAGLVGLALAVVAAVAACSSWVADDFVDGGSYGPERRWSLRAPGALLAGPIEVVWAVGVAGGIVGPLVAAAADGGGWARIAGVAAAVAGAALVVLALRSLHTLSTRYVVYVPRGLTIVDPLVVAEAVHLPRAAMARIGPAPADTEAVDLTQRAPGLALEVDMTSPVELVVRDGRRRATETTASRLLVTPGRPGSLLHAARDHRLPVG